MKKFLIIMLSTVFLGSCTKNLTDKNNDPKNPTNVPSYTLFTNGQKEFVDLLTTTDVNTNVYRMLAQQWTETTYTDESNYDLATRDIPTQWWNGLYRDVLKSFAQSKVLIPTDVLSAGQAANELAIVDIMQVYAYYYLVTNFGNIPYSEALDFEISQPKYDDAATIYADLLSRLNTDIAALNDGEEGFGSADLLYGGDITAWRKFANSIKLKMGILIADSDPGTAQSTVESAAAEAFTSNADNATLQYLSAPPNTNPAYTDQIQSQRGDFVVTDFFVDQLVALNDPRIPAYFLQDPNGTYTGGVYGTSNNFAALSKPSGYEGGSGVFQPDFASTILSYAEVEFYLAEAAARGYNVGGTAESHYDAAITASIEEWGGTAGDAATYLAQPAVAYATAAGDYKQKIGTQAWFAFYNRGYEAWTSWRRLDVPTLVAPPDALSDVPVRLVYSVTEQNLNKSNFDAAATAIGGDVVSTKLWFDKQ